MVRRSIKWHDELRASVLSDSESRDEYESFKVQLALVENMKHVRESADLTQDDVAEKMHTTKSAVARLEAAGGKNKHSPSLKTLIKYALALGYRLEIKLKKAS